MELGRLTAKFSNLEHAVKRIIGFVLDDLLLEPLDCTEPTEKRVIRKYETADCEDVLNVWACASAVAHPFLSHEFLESEHPVGWRKGGISKARTR